MPTAEAIIRRYGLEPLNQEGGFFRQVWRSPVRIANGRLGAGYPTEGDHALGTVIQFLITEESFSAMHRLGTPEHWFYHLGDAAEMLLLHPDGSSELLELGPELSAGQAIHRIVPAGSWQGTRLKSGGRQGFLFGSCVMVPGFEWTDFELGARERLAAAYPAAARAIAERTRSDPVNGTL